MFEKESEERARKLEEKQTLGVYDNDEDLARDEGFNEGEVVGYEQGFKDGAEFGYNKANEWHWIKDGDFPEEEKEYLIYTKKKKLEIRKIHISGDGKNYLTDVFLMRDLESVIAWKEIVPPELEESEL